MKMMLLRFNYSNTVSVNEDLYIWHGWPIIVFSIPNYSIRMPDAENFKKILSGYIALFNTPIESITADKGYYFKANEELALDFGIEPIIGHIKNSWQIGRSRMKTNRTTEASGFVSIFGFNIRQIVR